jgi:predicted transcriptional regulator
MQRKHDFFLLAAKANLTGEQAGVLMRLLASEHDGLMEIKQNQIAEELGMPESNVSRSIKALIDIGLIRKEVVKMFDGRPVFQINKRFLTMDTMQSPMNSCRCCGEDFPYQLIQFATIKMNGETFRELTCGLCKEKYGVKSKRSVGTSGRQDGSLRLERRR